MYTGILGLVFGLVGLPLAIYGLYRIGYGDRDAGTVALTCILGTLWAIALYGIAPIGLLVAVIAGVVGLPWGSSKRAKDDPTDAEWKDEYESDEIG